MLSSLDMGSPHPNNKYHAEPDYSSKSMEIIMSKNINKHILYKVVISKYCFMHLKSDTYIEVIKELYNENKILYRAHDISRAMIECTRLHKRHKFKELTMRTILLIELILIAGLIIF